MGKARFIANGRVLLGSGRYHSQEAEHVVGFTVAADYGHVSDRRMGKGPLFSVAL